MVWPTGRDAANQRHRLHPHLRFLPAQGRQDRVQLDDTGPSRPAPASGPPRAAGGTCSRRRLVRSSGGDRRHPRAILAAHASRLGGAEPRRRARAPGRGLVREAGRGGRGRAALGRAHALLRPFGRRLYERSRRVPRAFHRRAAPRLLRPHLRARCPLLRGCVLRRARPPARHAQRLLPRRGCHRLACEAARGPALARGGGYCHGGLRHVRHARPLRSARN
mmetsp:Transcript_941/g.3046  ORF Transcript_941/g.3046 Transcript_941/m.3046 type:complete len:221 (+) Transcript_941:395-1057(+)